jgi:hypothetical protein
VAGSVPNVNIDGGVSAVLSNSIIRAFNGNNINIGVDKLARETRVLNCTLLGVCTNCVGVALGATNGSAILGNDFSPTQGALNVTVNVMDFGTFAGTTDASIHLNDVRAMSTGIVCRRGDGNNCTDNPGAKDC